LGNLTSLTTLKLSGCEGVIEIPKLLGNLTSLITLDLSGCKDLKEIPEAFCGFGRVVGVILQRGSVV